MTVTNTGRRIALVGVLALMLALVPFSASALTGDIALDYEINPDIDASDAVQTSALIAQNFDAAENVLIATSGDFADALASGSLQGADSPLFFVEDALHQVHLDEFERLGATGATILGGTAAVSEDVEDELTDAGLEVDRLAGGTRIETAIAIAGATLADDADNILLARAFGADDGSDPTQAFADSLAAGGWAADTGTPILLTQTDVLTGNTSDYLASLDGVGTVTIIGGEAAVSADVATAVEDLGFTVERIADDVETNRFGTAVAIAEARGFASADEADTVIFAEGQSDTAYIDGFAAASLSAAVDAPILLTNGEDVPPATQAWIGDAGTFEQLPVDAATIAAHLLPQVENEEGLAEALDLELVEHMLASVPDEDPNTGIIIAEDDAGNSYTFQPEDGSSPVVVTYDDDDNFTVDGTEATVAAFENATTVGDQVTYTEGEGEEADSHDLVNQAPATEGTIGNVNTGATTLEIIEPVSGVTISPAAIDYDAECDLYQVDGAPALQATFEGDLNEGDSLDQDEDAVGVNTCALTNGTVAGSVSLADTSPDPLVNPVEFQVGNLGDDYEDGNDEFFSADSANTDQTYFVDGTESTHANFLANISDGDDGSVSREAGDEIISITNQAPSSVAGQSTFNSVIGTNTLAIATASGEETETYDDGANFIVNGILADVTDFEEALSIGDQVTYTPADAIGGTDETVTLTDQPLTGGVTDPDTVGQTLDVLATNGTTPLADDLSYIVPLFGGTSTYYVNGEAVPIADFEDELDDIDDGDKTGVIEIRDVDAGGVDVATEFRLDTMAS